MWFVYAMLGNVLWSVTDVWASVVLNRFESDSVVVGCILGTIDAVLLLALLCIGIPEVRFLHLFILSGVCTYLGLLAFFRLLLHVDVSVSSAAWVFMSLGIALGGLLIFGETWTQLQTIGAMLSVCGVLLLTFWHKHVSMLRTCGLLAGVGLLFVPHFLINEYVLLAGLTSFDVLYWNILFHSLLAIAVPLLWKSRRRALFSMNTTKFIRMYVVLFPRTMLTLLATYFVIRAYETGLASLVGIAENGQPFFLIAFAWIAVQIFPKYGSKELLTAQSLQIKVISFCTVFVGLTMLAA